MWNLLTRDFRWQVPDDFPVSVRPGRKRHPRGPKLQVFEIAVAAIFATLRPDYLWYVTPNTADNGVDFVGRQEFLRDDVLEIAAAITVGGQCKKRSKVNSVLDELAGSLMKMAATLKPTFFIVAFAAPVSDERIEQAKETVESQLHRNCHILGRRQIEGLLRDHYDVLERVLLQALTADEIEDVRTYLAATRTHREPEVTISTPTRALAGVPFQVVVEVVDDRLITQKGRLLFTPTLDIDPLGPIGALSDEGVLLEMPHVHGDLRYGRCVLEMSSYGVGVVDLGHIDLRLIDESFASALGSVIIVENLRPRYFERPFRSNSLVLRREYDRALASGVGVVAVVGAGGGGKSRVCEEFSLDRQRHGVRTVAVSQLKTHNEPHRILADLLIRLVPDNLPHPSAADAVLDTLSAFDEVLSARVATSVRAVFGESRAQQATLVDHDVLSALVVLLASHLSRGSLVIHLRDLHWCTADVISILDKLLWQVSRVLESGPSRLHQASSGVLFILEGRTREQQGAENGYDTRAFDAWLRKLNRPTTAISPLVGEDARDFVRRLFEQRFNDRNHLHQSLLDLQSELIDRIYRAAGGNPLHSLAQVELLRQRGVLGQSRETGLMYLISPEAVDGVLPADVNELILARWFYLREHVPNVALVLWASALLDDRLPLALFRLLVNTFANGVSLHEIFAEGFLEEDGTEVAFRHENFFAALHNVTVAEAERVAAVGVYAGWYGRRTEPADRLRLARSLLVHPDPDIARALSALDDGLRVARETGDARLTRRIAALRLDTLWASGASQTSLEEFTEFCDDELTYAADLLDSDRLEASRRVSALMARIKRRLRDGPFGSPSQRRRLERLSLSAETVYLRFLFVDRPITAVERGFAIVSRIVSALDRDDPAWREVEMEARHALAVALAIGGELDRATPMSRQAAELARLVTTPRSPQIIATYANILLAQDPQSAEELLRGLLAASPADGAALDEISINLGMTMIVKGYQSETSEPTTQGAFLNEARSFLLAVFRRADSLGRHPDAAASALLLGTADALEDRDSAVMWFAQAVAAATRGGHRESLWKARLNLATASHRYMPERSAEIRAHVMASLELMTDTLSVYPKPQESARFKLLRNSLLQASRLLTRVGDPGGSELLEQYPSLLTGLHFSPKSAAGTADTSYEWLRVDDEGYVLY